MSDHTTTNPTSASHDTQGPPSPQDAPAFSERPPGWTPMNNEGLDLYKYEPLEVGSIRLMLLFEAESVEDDLECAILHVPLGNFSSDDGDDDDDDDDDDEDDVDDKDRSYIALSYVWGDRSDINYIYVGDKPLPIGDNLNRALREIRRRGLSTYLWVDAICIDQSNTTERNHQVQQMRDVYSFARETIIYLGDLEGSNSERSAWNFLARNSDWVWDHLTEERNYETPAILEEGLEQFRGDLHDVHHAVLDREWFRRIWVLQEVVVAREVSIQCGHHRISWDSFVKSVIFKSRSPDPYGESLQQQRRFEAVKRIWQARVAFHLRKRQEQYLPPWHSDIEAVGDGRQLRTDILSTLVRARALEASDYRDKIFALLGISTGYDWRAKGTIDYGKSAIQVYTNFAKDYMQMTGNYELLSYLDFRFRSALEENMNELNYLSTSVLEPPGEKGDQGLLNERDLASWVPSWSTHPSGETLRPIYEVVPELSLASWPNSRNSSNSSTSGDIENYRAWSSDGRALMIHGRVLGTVDNKHCRLLSLAGQDEDNFRRLREAWRNPGPHRQYSLAEYILVAWTIIMHMRGKYGTQLTIYQDEFSPTSIGVFLGKPPRHRTCTAPDHLESLINIVDNPKPNSIEGFLVDRAHRALGWSNTLTDGRCLGRYFPGCLVEVPAEGDSLAQEHPESPKSASILLPVNMHEKSLNLVVHFPGARVPFIIQPVTERSESSSDDELECEIPSLKGTEKRVKGRLIGECWINDLESILTDGAELDHLFIII